MNGNSASLARNALILRFLLKYRGAGVFTGIDLDADFLGAAGRASVRAEVAEEVRDYLEEGVAGGELAVQMGALPELRDAMSLAWRILLLWLAVVALLVLAGWVA